MKLNIVVGTNIAGWSIASQPGKLGAIGDKSSVKNLSSLINTITFGFFSRSEDIEEDRSKQRGSFQSQVSKKKRKRQIKDCGMDLRCIANYISSKAKHRPKRRTLASVRKNQFENIWVSNTDILTHMHDVYGKFRLDPNGEVIH